mmetsp:Transcript_26354/g.77382  ORF Transcript_26354/g.77382 Transcript_26354/m.77382 type:complete len:273 (+) Transcript_26354:30-848(+)
MGFYLGLLAASIIATNPLVGRSTPALVTLSARAIKYASRHPTSGTSTIFANTPEDMANWEGMWTRGIQPGQAFDAARTEPAFQDLLDKAATVQPPLPTPSAKSRAFVPGCGRGYAVVSLERAGYAAEGLEISPTAARAARDYLSSQGAKAEVRVGDFFALPEEGQYSVVFDSTFLCALHPTQREAWAKKTSAILAQDGELITNIFPVRPDGEPDPADGAVGNGPPYALSDRLVTGLLAPHGWRQVSISKVPEAMRARPGGLGMEFLARWRRQ